MTSLITDNLVAIQDICRHYGVQKMFVFGSAANEKKFTADSDVDLLYKLRPEVAALAVDEQPDFFELLFTLEGLLGRKVDLVDLTRIENPYFIQAINQHKQKIYEA